MAAPAHIARANGRKGGRPKGVQNQETIDKAIQREALRALVIAELRPLVSAQIRAAKGLAHFFLRDDKGQFKRITDPEEIEAALNSGNENAFWIDEKDPSTAAFADLMNRALDKPIEAVEVEHKGGLDLRWLDAPK